MMLGGLPGKHTDTKARPDSPSQYYRARLFQASANGHDYYRGSHREIGEMQVIDSEYVFIPNRERNESD